MMNINHMEDCNECGGLIYRPYFKKVEQWTKPLKIKQYRYRSHGESKLEFFCPYCRKTVESILR